MRKRTLRFLAAAGAAVLALGTLSACGDDSDDSGNGGGGGGGGDKSVTIPIAAGWDEDTVVTYLWKHVLEENGYEVSTENVDIGPAFAGVARGDYDLFFDTWLPTTHKTYWDKYGDQVEDLGVWYDQATLNLAVPEYMDVDSVADLNDVADDVDGEITGIDPGAGLTKAVDKAIQDYDLDLTQKTSSTAAMLAALKKATDAKEPIIVALWHPHWAYSAFPLKDLEDPKGSLGDSEEIHSIASQDFAESAPDVAEAVGKWKMDDKTLADLEKVALQENDDPEAGVEQWIKDNQDYVNKMM